jgi:hypothetical protein
MEKICTQPGCTVAATGKCVLNNDPTTCPHLAEPKAAGDIAAAVSDVAAPTQGAQFYPGLELGLEDSGRLMGRTYCTMVAIFGPPDAGKTAALVSLYLALANNALEGFRFCNSFSLMALEQIARGARRWNDGALPGKVTSHTSRDASRSAGFLHLKIKNTTTENTTDLLLPDLPGEWTNSLIDHSDTDPFDFALAADAIWLIIDGRQLKNELALTLRRNDLLIKRLGQFLKECSTLPLVIVATQLDSVGSEIDPSLNLLREKAELAGFANCTAVRIASFSEQPDVVAPSTGLSTLLQRTLARPQAAGNLSKQAVAFPQSIRRIFDFRVP